MSTKKFPYREATHNIVYDSEKLGKLLINSANFTNIFNNSIALISDTANYLDTEGRVESRKMSREHAVTYARESMLLTSKLIQLVSWLLLNKSVGNNEIPLAEAYMSENKIQLNAWSKYCLENIRTLPEKMQDLILRSEIIYQNVKRMDDILMKYAKQLTTETEQKTNRIASDIEKLRNIFSHH